MTIGPATNGTERRLDAILEEQRKTNALLQQIVDAQHPQPNEPLLNVSMTSPDAATAEAATKAVRRKRGVA